MSAKVLIEIIGYVGTVLVLISMLMTSVVRLRIFNLAGSIVFSVYTVLIRSYPTAILNIILAGINICQLARLLRGQKIYQLIETDWRDGYFSYLLSASAADIRGWFPGFSMEDIPADISWLVCCGNDPACLFLGRTTGPGELEVLLDYALPAYRDTSVGRWLYGSLAGKGYRTLVFRQDAPKHIPYLEKVGYQNAGERGYVLELS